MPREARKGTYSERGGTSGSPYTPRSPAAHQIAVQRRWRAVPAMRVLPLLLGLLSAILNRHAPPLPAGHAALTTKPRSTP